MSLAFVVVVDGSGHSKLAAVGLLDGEPSTEFCWFFKQLKEYLAPQEISTLFSDSDAAILSAVATELPNTVHRLCIWHIGENLKKKFKKKYGKAKYANFKATFDYARKAKSIADFHERWNQMKASFPETKEYM